MASDFLSYTGFVNMGYNYAVNSNKYTILYRDISAVKSIENLFLNVKNNISYHVSVVKIRELFPNSEVSFVPVYHAGFVYIELSFIQISVNIIITFRYIYVILKIAVFV